jgi:hypothetical protein
LAELARPCSTFNRMSDTPTSRPPRLSRASSPDSPAESELLPDGRARMHFHTDAGSPVQPEMRKLLEGLVAYEDKAGDNREGLEAKSRPLLG